MTRTDLDPWRVILHHLFSMDTRELPKVLDRAGLAVDWALTEKEDYSAKTRLAAYRPRIAGAYEALNDEDRLRVAYVVVSSFDTARTEQLDQDLRRIGWKIESGQLTPASAQVSELFFPTGSQHDAYVEIRRILTQAKTSVTIVDPYVDGTIFVLLGTSGSLVTSVRILTHKHPGDFELELCKFQAQHAEAKVEARATKEFHDRFVVIDQISCWHIGSSIKDAGVKAFMISQVEDARNREALLAQVEDSWQNAAPIAGRPTGGTGNRLAPAEVQENFEVLRRRTLHCGITNEIPVELSRLRAFLVETGLVEKPEFKPFFERWLSSPFVTLGVPVPNAFTPEEIRQLQEDLRALRP